MKAFLAITLLFSSMIARIPAQQNWAGIPCSKMQSIDVINKIMVDSLHNEIIMYSVNGNTICNTSYDGIFAYDGNNFKGVDGGINTHEGGVGSSGLYVWDCITYGDKTLFGGMFNSVGSAPVYAKSLALWNGVVWDTFPKHIFRNLPIDNTDGGFYGFIKWNGKLWMYGGFTQPGTTYTTNLMGFDGNTFTAVPPMPVSTTAPITKMIAYKNKLIGTGLFYDSQNPNWFRLAQFDGTNWSPVGNGVQGGIANVTDMKIYNDTLYISGAWSKASGNISNYVMKWDGTQLYDAGFSNNFCGWGGVWSLIPFKNRLYAFGQFPCAANQKAFGVAYYENGAWTVPNDSIAYRAIVGAVLYDNTIYIAGGFNSINGDTTIHNIAKLICPDFDAASGCVSNLAKVSPNLIKNVYPNPANREITVEFEVGQNIDKITIVNPLGEEMVMILNPGSKQKIELISQPRGIYFLIAESRNGKGVFKVLKE